MEWTVVVAVAVMVAGIVGTVVPMLPGLPLIWVTLLVFALVEGFDRVDGTFLGVTLLVTVAAEAGEYYVRAWGARRFRAGRAGAWGAVLGALAGLFFLPLGLVLGPFLGALTAELLSGRNLPQALRAGWGGLVGTLGFLPVKLALAIGMTVAFVLRVVA